MLGLDQQSHVGRAVMVRGVPLNSNIGNLSNHMSKYHLLLKRGNTNKEYTQSLKERTIQRNASKPLHVALYLTNLLACDASDSTVNSTVFSIKWMQNKSGLKDFTDNSFVKQIENSAKRLFAKSRRTKDLVNNDMLQSLRSLHKDTSDVLDFKKLIYDII